MKSTPFRSAFLIPACLAFVGCGLVCAAPSASAREAAPQEPVIGPNVIGPPFVPPLPQPPPEPPAPVIPVARFGNGGLAGGVSPGIGGGVSRPSGGAGPAGGPAPIRRGKGGGGNSDSVTSLPVPWRGVFPVLAAEQGYEGSELAMTELLGAGCGPAAWPRDEIPSLVLVSNPADPGQAAAVRRLEGDERFRLASQLFNCFRLDARSFRAPPAEVELSVHATDGRLIGKVTTEKLFGVLDLLETAWRAHTGRDLSRSIPQLDVLVTGIAACDARIAHFEKELLCDKCPKRHEDAAGDLAKSVAMRRAYLAALDRWRTKPEAPKAG